MTQIDHVLTAIDANQTDALARLFELMRIPSISTDPAYAGECDKAAQWLVNELNSIGFTASMRPTAGRPGVASGSRATQCPARESWPTPRSCPRNLGRTRAALVAADCRVNRAPRGRGPRQVQHRLPPAPAAARP